ncbi:MAG TPA: VTT domain-containing protein [Candidatus Acidoferrales bacterium]|nr:VTT domain-containing protein [Candidatus Acidoferrales bacterium]
MLSLLVQHQQRRNSHPLVSALLHLGAAGLFFLAILDSSPIPSFGAPDIVVAVLAASHHPLWYEYAAAATAGSVLGAYFTFRLARRAGEAYLHSKFKGSRVSKFLKLFRRWGEGTLVASTLVPLPTPTSMFFAAAGASDFATGKFLAIVTICRAIRYFGIAYIAGHYGRNLLRVLRHPVQHWGWLALFLAIACALIVGGIIASRKLEATSG